MIALTRKQPDCLFFILSGVSRLVIGSNPTAGNEIHSKKGHEAATNEFPCAIGRERFKVTVENGTPDDHGKSKKNELGWDHLSRVKPLQGSVDIANLHQSAENKDEHQKVGDRKSYHMP